MTSTALVLFDNSFETEGLTALLRQFEPTLDVQVVPDLDRALSGLAAREDVAWLVVDADWLGEVADAGVAELVEQANGARLVVFGKAAAAGEAEEAARFLRLGALAWVPRRFSPQAVMAVLALVRAGERFRPVARHDETGAAAAIATSSSKGNHQTLAQFGLTAAEHEVLLRVAQGKTNLQIALDLGKSEGTVRIQMSSILSKLKVRNRGEAIIVAMREESVIREHLERAGQNPLDLSWLHPHMEHRRCRAGQVLFQEGEPGREMFLVQRGCVSLPQLGLEMRERDVFGEIAIFSPHHRRTSSAVCTTAADLFVLGEDKVRQMHYLNPAFAMTMLQLVTNRLLADRQRAG